jgi:hypothetical protein
VPLPRVWQKAEGGLAEPLRVVETHGHPSVAGGDYLSVQMRAAVAAFDRRTKADIRKPLIKWLEAMDAVRVSNLFSPKWTGRRGVTIHSPRHECPLMLRPLLHAPLILPGSLP